MGQGEERGKEKYQNDDWSEDALDGIASGTVLSED